jgi:small conductance mechanosensitive channel
MTMLATAPARLPATLSDEVANLPNMLIAFAKSRGPDVALALALLVVAWFFSGWIRRAVVRGFSRASVDLTLGKFFGNLARWAVLAFALITCAGTLGLPTATFATIIGAAGLAIGLALQGNLSNLASGVLLLIFRPFKVGDSVIVAGQAGVVDGIDLFTTYLDTLDNRRIIVPNSAVFSGVIENQTRHERRVVTLNVPVSGVINPDFSHKQLRAALDRVVASAPGALKTPEPAVVLAEIFPTITWTLSVHTETRNYATVRQALLREVKTTLDEHSLAPPVPIQLVRHVS